MAIKQVSKLSTLKTIKNSFTISICQRTFL